MLSPITNHTQVFMLLPNILNEKGLFGRLALLQMESVAALTSDLSRLLNQADKHTSAAEAQASSQLAPEQLALDRLAQALQVAMASGALLCSRGKRAAKKPEPGEAGRIYQRVQEIHDGQVKVQYKDQMWEKCVFMVNKGRGDTNLMC